MSGFMESWPQKVFVGTETAWGTAKGPAAADALQILEIELNGERAKVFRGDTIQDRGQKAAHRVLGRYSADWRVKAYINPNGADTTIVAPDAHDLLYALFGNYTTTQTAVTYSPKNVWKRGLSIWNINESEDPMYQVEGVVGAIASKGVFTFGNAELPTLEISGPAQRRVFMVNDSFFETTVIGAASTYLVNVQNANRFSKDTWIYFLNENDTTFTNAGAGYQITSVHRGTTSQRFIEIGPPGIAAAETIGPDWEIRPLSPTPTTAGAPIDSCKGSIQIGGTTTQYYHFIGGTVTFDEKRVLINDEFGTAEASHISQPEIREVTFELTGYVEQEYLASIQNVADHSLDTVPVTIIIGDTYGSRMRVSMPYCLFDSGKCDFPRNAAGKLTIAGRAMASSGEDEIAVSYI